MSILVLRHIVGQLLVSQPCMYFNMKNSFDLTIYRITELEAFADSLGIIRKNTHVHDIVWEYSER